jgi:outer membrane protein, heavy metal efflux system
MMEQRVYNPMILPGARLIWAFGFLVALWSGPRLQAVPQAQSSGVASSNAGNGQALRLQDLIEELVRANPDLQAARKGYEAALTRPAQESALPEPRVTTGWISNGAPYPGAGLGTEATSNLGIQFAQEIPFPGKRTLKGGIAQKQAESEAQQIRARELDLITQLKEKFYELRFVYESQDLIKEKQALLQQLAKAAEVRYASGKGAQQDIIRSATEVSILENRLIVLEQKRLSLNAEISALLNRSPDADLGRPEKATSVPVLEPFELLRARALECSPMLAAQKAVIDGRQLNVQSAQKAYYPDFDVMGGYYYQGSLKPMWEFKVQINVPLYFWKKQRPGLEEAGALLAGAQRDYRAQEQAISSRLRVLYVAARASQNLSDLFLKQIVPQSELALESAMASYVAGNMDFLSVLANFSSILDYQLNYHEQQAEYLKALAGMEMLLGNAFQSSDRSNIVPGSEVR